MNPKRHLLRWGALALAVTLMSGCCIAPWGGPGRYYGVTHEHDGYDHRDDYHDGWRHYH